MKKYISRFEEEKEEIKETVKIGAVANLLKQVYGSQASEIDPDEFVSSIMGAFKVLLSKHPEKKKIISNLIKSFKSI